jgi:hypothetical protein
MSFHVLALYVFCVASFVGGATCVDCNDHHACALGALRESILTHPTTDKTHPIVRALLRYKHLPECDNSTANAAVAQKKQTDFPDHVSVYGPQCESQFSFTTAEGFLGHAALLLNVALGTLWYEMHKLRTSSSANKARMPDENIPLLNN